MFNTRFDDQYTQVRRPIKKEDVNNVNIKEVTYGGKQYTMVFSRTQERCIDGKITNTLTITHIDSCEVKQMTVCWNGDSECMIRKSKDLIEKYILSEEHQPTQAQIFQQWDGDLDRYNK